MAEILPLHVGRHVEDPTFWGRISITLNLLLGVPPLVKSTAKVGFQNYWRGVTQNPTRAVGIRPLPGLLTPVRSLIRSSTATTTRRSAERTIGASRVDSIDYTTTPGG